MRNGKGEALHLPRVVVHYRIQMEENRAADRPNVVVPRVCYGSALTWIYRTNASGGLNLPSFKSCRPSLASFLLETCYRTSGT